MKFDHNQLLAISITAAVNVALYLVTLIAAIYVCIRFLIPLKIKNTNIVLFYVLTFLLFIFRIIEVGHMIFIPTAMQWEYAESNNIIF